MLVLYVVGFQFYFFAGFNGGESVVTKPFLNVMVGAIVTTNILFILLCQGSIKSTKVLWLIYMFVTSGIGSIHYYFKYYIHDQENT